MTDFREIARSKGVRSFVPCQEYRNSRFQVEIRTWWFRDVDKSSVMGFVCVVSDDLVITMANNSTWNEYYSLIALLRYEVFFIYSLDLIVLRRNLKSFVGFCKHKGINRYNN